MAFVGPVEIWYFSIFYLSLATGFRFSIISVLMLVVSLMLYEAWGVLLNDIFDRDVDKSAGKSGIVRGHRLNIKVMIGLVIVSGGVSWLLILLSNGTWLFYAVWVIAYILGFFYSTPPVRLKNRGYLSLVANSVLERPLPVLIIFLFFRVYGIEIVAFPILSELIWSVFKHQVHDVDEDTRANVRTFAVKLGHDLSYRIVKYVVNPLSVLSVLAFAIASALVVPKYAWTFEAFIAFIVVGVAISIAMERRGKIYTDPLDPPYILFLNLAFLLTILLGLSIIELWEQPTYFPLVALFLLSLVPNVRHYRPILSRAASRLIR